MAVLRRVGLQVKRQGVERLVDCLDGIDRSDVTTELMGAGKALVHH